MWQSLASSWVFRVDGLRVKKCITQGIARRPLRPFCNLVDGNVRCTESSCDGDAEGALIEAEGAHAVLGSPNGTLRLDLSSGVLGLDPEGSAAVRSSLVTCVVSCDSGAIDAEGDGAEDAVCATDSLGRMSRQTVASKCCRAKHRDAKYGLAFDRRASQMHVDLQLAARPSFALREPIARAFPSSPRSLQYRRAGAPCASHEALTAQRKSRSDQR